MTASGQPVPTDRRSTGNQISKRPARGLFSHKAGNSMLPPPAPRTGGHSHQQQPANTSVSMHKTETQSQCQSHARPAMTSVEGVLKVHFSNAERQLDCPPSHVLQNFIHIVSAHMYHTGETIMCQRYYCLLFTKYSNTDPNSMRWMIGR